MDAIRWVQAEKDKRAANRGYKPYRAVLIIDEIAQLANNNEAKEDSGRPCQHSDAKGHKPTPPPNPSPKTAVWVRC